MAVDGTLGALLQGVSQQPEAVRPTGKLTEQVNFNSDVVQGLTSRPGLVEHNVTHEHPHGVYGFFDVRIGGVDYVLGYQNDTLLIWDEWGNEQNVSYQDGAAQNYVGPNMRPYVYDDTLFLCNRDRIVQKSSITDNIRNGREGLVYCLGGKFDRKYKITVTYKDNGNSFNVSYTTPDGTNEGDADKTSAAHIMQQLTDAIRAQGSTGGIETSIRDNVLYLKHDNREFVIEARDGDSNSTLRGLTDRVRAVEELPEFAPSGYFVRIENSDDGDEDDFYLRFKQDKEGDWGVPGAWEEFRNPDEPHAFDKASMPHQLRKTGSNSFRLERAAWVDRRTGDDKTNEFPDLVGHPIRDIAGFQSRLVFVAGPFCVMSRTNEPLDLFKKSALAEIDTDPISISSTQEGTVRLDWIIPFDRDLVCMSDPGTGQFIISGQSKLTPSNASMSKTTSFEMRGGAKPVETGKTILFPFKSGKYSGIKEFFTNDDVATNGADTLTETLDRYIEGLVDHMAVNANFNIAGFKTSDSNVNNVVWIYKYLWQSNEKVQSSWSKWEFPARVEYFYFTGSLMRVILSENHPGKSGKRFIFTDLDLDIPVDEEAGYHVTLDRKTTQTADGAHLVKLTMPDAAFCQAQGCLTPGRPVSPVSVSGPNEWGRWTYTFDALTVPAGANVIGGQRIERFIQPTMPFIRGREGSVKARTRLTVTTFLVHYEDTGYFKSSMHSRYRAAPTVFEVDWFPMDNDPEDPAGTGLRSGRLSIPYGERTDWSTWTLSSDDIRPTNILEIEWVGHAYKGGR